MYIWPISILFQGLEKKFWNSILFQYFQYCVEPWISWSSLQFLTLWRQVEIRDFWAKNTKTHLALHMNFSGLVSATDRVKSSRDRASLIACTRKKNFWLGVRISCEWCNKWRTFRPPWPTAHTHTNSGFFKLVEALLQIHWCFFSPV